MTDKNNIPIVVDLDETLIKTDMFFEAMVHLLKAKPLLAIFIPFWLIKGRFYTKHKISSYVTPNVETLPYNEDFIEYLKAEKKKGRKIYLATATLKTIADKISDYLGIFDGVFGSENNVNLKGTKKKKVLIENFGVDGYVYAGDSPSDLKVWDNSHAAILVNADKKTANKAGKLTKIEKEFNNKPNLIKLVIKQIRVYQWVKNILIFIPMLLAHNFFNSDMYLKGLAAFLSFSFSASFVYVLNDLLDLESDRQHPRKKKRPLASGNLLLKTAFFIAPILIILGLGIAFVALDTSFIITLIIYLIITNLYSFYLKKMYVLDIIVLSALYTIRLIAGAHAAGVELTLWLLAFSIFIFTSLATLKRYTEVLVMINQNKSKTKGRGYFTNDKDLLLSMGTSSGLLSVLVFALYVNSPDVLSLYNNQEVLYLIGPVLLYWILRIWFKAHRGLMHDDPIVFAGKDPVSYLLAVIVGFIIVGAMM